MKMIEIEIICGMQVTEIFNYFDKIPHSFDIYHRKIVHIHENFTKHQMIRNRIKDKILLRNPYNTF